MAEKEPLFPLLGIARHRMEIDGEGVTTLVAGAGCPLSCAYCINKTLLRQTPSYFTASELYEKTKIDDLYFLATGGGLCFGGGESLLHMDFYEALRPLCKDWRLTAETSLNVPAELVRRAANVFDYFIVDIKSLNPEIYRKYTGKYQGPLMQNLRWLASSVDPSRIIVRVPLIQGYNNEEDQKNSKRILKIIGITRIEPFAYTIK